MQIATKLGRNLIDLPVTPREFADVEITYHELKIKKNPFEIPLIGDVHYASQECHEDFFFDTLDGIKRKQNNALIIMGDMYEANDHSSPDDAIFNQKYTNEDSKDLIADTLKPKRLSNKIWVWMEANHDGERSRKKTGTANSRDICREIGVPYARISCYNIIDFNDHRLILYTNHGKWRSTPKWVGTRRKTWEESMTYPEADIIAIGHIHKLHYGNIKPNENITENVVIDYENMCMDTRPAQFKKRLITGHWLQYLKGYGQKRAYPPNPAGYPILKLYPDGRYDVEKVWYRDWENGNL